MRKFNYPYVTLDDGVSSQYEGETFLPGQAVKAKYIRSVNVCDNGNPFIEALPLPRETRDEMKAAYEIGIPGYRNNIPKSLTYCLREIPLLEDVRFKLNFHNSLEIEHYNCIVESYRHREFLQGIQCGCKVIGRSAGATTKGYTLVGKSGSGKSAALDVLLSRYPQVISHNFEGIGEFKQITYLMVNAIPNDNFNAFYRAIGKAVDQALGITTPLYEEQVRKAKNIGEKSLIIEHLIELFAIGVIIVDEIELMSFSLSRENSFTGLARLSNETKVCFVLCGLDTAVKKWNTQEWTTRRSGVQIKADSYCEDYTSFRVIMKKLLQYNWQNSPLELSNETMQEIYNQTGGVICYIILLYERLQVDLLGQNDITVTPEYVQFLMEKHYPELKKIIETRKLTKEDVLANESTVAKYQNTLITDIDMMMQEAAKRSDAEEYLNEEKSSPDSIWSTNDCTDYVLKIIKLLPDYKAYNEATISHNIEIVREKAARKNKELSPEEILTETCRELSKKHTDKRARRKKGSVPSVSQMQNHMNTGT